MIRHRPVNGDAVWVVGESLKPIVTVVVYVGEAVKYGVTVNY